jgi:hypothetical protein
MRDFMFLYRIPTPTANQPAESPQQMQERMQRWTAWFKDLESRGVLKNIGAALESTGALVKDKKPAITDGPFAEAKDIIGGYSVVSAENLAHANELAIDCPVFKMGGFVEVRPIRQM